MAFQKKKWIPALEPDVKEIDFKDVRFLSRYVTDRGRILPRKITGLSCKQQKMITRAIKRARQMSLLPFINYGT
ncbi:MAG: 30S ribosomal protein S18 [Candidatus Melainabacteria bacterium RIFCSPLOWO2_02_FULL_35_15]|nr:MAG: 30S ribosomal protein S18 [Candidatus Melainabacteria bacterium RIFCSPLOWO2_12_FULL_35_11]OGI14288.1 MAG: 30S ribosomal protein S18 [Candidatus Melainabacteria bacterium RIFCSPLOWO2_02_FULL_35_15]